MSEFAVNKDLFGRYANIPTDFSGTKHIYKIISLLESNGYCDAPICYNSEQKWHDKIVPVVNVVHCGVDESKVVRVALSDCELLPAADVAPVVHGEWLNFTGDFSTAECDKCGELYEVSPDEKPCEDFFSAFKQFYKFCPNCGAKIDKEKRNERD